MVPKKLLLDMGFVKCQNSPNECYHWRGGLWVHYKRNKKHRSMDNKEHCIYGDKISVKTFMRKFFNEFKNSIIESIKKDISEGLNQFRLVDYWNKVPLWEPPAGCNRGEVVEWNTGEKYKCIDKIDKGE